MKSKILSFDQNIEIYYLRLTREYFGKRASMRGLRMEDFDLLVDQYEPMIWRIISSLHIYKNKEEFFQTGLIALWEAQKHFESEKGTFPAYAYSYIKGRILSELTKEHKHENRTVRPKEEFWEIIKDENAEQGLEKEFILSFCKNLTENQKKWVLYTAIDFLSVREIANIEGVSISAVKAWKKGAKEKLQGMMV
jgi:DNA-directed RNA polymerase